VSDGPHKCLPMNRAWKAAAERAGRAAFEPSEVGGRVEEAVLGDCRTQLRPTVMDLLKKLVGNGQQELFPEQFAEEIRRIRHEVAECAVAVRVLDQVEDALEGGVWTQDGLVEAVADGMRENACAGIRQIEEIYRRNPESSWSHAAGIRKRLEDGVAHASFEAAALSLLGLGAASPSRAARMSGIDDGPRLC